MRVLGERILGLLETRPKYKLFNQLHFKLQVKSQINEFLRNQPITINQHEIRHNRMSIPRNSPNKAVYAQFLQKLYPLEGDIHHEMLYKAYCSLPSPQPLFIEPQHFEQFLCEFLNSGGSKRHRNTEHLVNVITDVSECDMEISLKEINNYMYLKYYNVDLDECMKTVKNDFKIAQNMNSDISTMNIFLKIALRIKDQSFISMIMSHIEKTGLKFDRITYQMLINYYCELGNATKSLDLFNNSLQCGIVPDICFFDGVIKSMVLNNEVHIAKQILETLFKNSYEANRKKSGQQRRNCHQRRLNLQELKYIDSLKLQEENSLLYIPEPNLESFLPLVNHFTTVEHFDALSIFKYLEELSDLHINVPETTYIQIFKGFQKQEGYDSEYLKFILNFLIHEPAIKYKRALFDSIIEAFLKHSRYQDKMINGIEKQWTLLKTRFNNESSFKQPGLEIKEFTDESIHKLTEYY